MIPCANPGAQYKAHRPAIDAAIARVLEGGRYILGDETLCFEREFAEYVGVEHAVAVGSGTEALHITLRAFDIGPGDEVVTVSHTAVATVAAIELCGARPVLVDIDARTFTLDVNAVEQAITPCTKAVIAVHLYGQPADLSSLRAITSRAGIHLIEDCAQSTGAVYQGRRTGAWGDAGCFSFYPTKNLGALGDGGMVVTDSEDVARTLRMLREYGWAQRYVSAISGWNTRLDEVQAGVLRVKLRHLDEDNARRQEHARRYGERLASSGMSLPLLSSADVRHVYHLYVIRCTQRDALKDFLAKRGVGTMVHYPVPIHLQPAYANRLRITGRLAESERAANEVLSLPMYPELTTADINLVSDAVLAFDQAVDTR
jgi:dTDP-4-amino-4,6-dideoxygalactose transaminase